MNLKKLFYQNSSLSNLGTFKQYKKYLKSIFPDSKINRIVYHHSNKNLEEFKNNFKEGYAAKRGVSPKAIFFLKKPVKKEFLSKRKYTLFCLINLKSPRVYNNQLRKKGDSRINEEIDLAIKNNQDGVIFKNIWDNKNWCTVYTTFSNTQTHILGSKKDIKKFKKFLTSI